MTQSAAITKEVTDSFIFFASGCFSFTAFGLDMAYNLMFLFGCFWGRPDQIIYYLSLADEVAQSAISVFLLVDLMKVLSLRTDNIFWSDVCFSLDFANIYYQT